MITPQNTIKVENKLYEGNVKFPIISLLIYIFATAVMLYAISLLNINSLQLGKQWIIVGNILLIVMVFVLIYLVVITVMRYNRLKKIYSESKEINTFEFFQNGVGIVQRVSDRIVDTEIKYFDSFTKFKETDTHFILYNRNGGQYNVSKTPLHESELNTLRKLFNLPYNGAVINLPYANLIIEPYIAEITDNLTDDNK